MGKKTNQETNISLACYVRWFDLVHWLQRKSVSIFNHKSFCCSLLLWLIICAGHKFPPPPHTWQNPTSSSIYGDKKKKKKEIKVPGFSELRGWAKREKSRAIFGGLMCRFWWRMNYSVWMMGKSFVHHILGGGGWGFCLEGMLLHKLVIIRYLGNRG